MTKKILITEIPEYLRLGLGVLVFSVCFLFAVPELERFLQISGIVVVGGAVLPAAFLLRFRANIPIRKTVLVTAIPAGILGTVIGFQGVTNSSAAVEGLGNGASIMSLTVVYGGSWAIIAYAFRETNGYDIPQVDRFTVLFCVLPVTLSILFGISTVPGIAFSDYVSPKVFILFFGVVVLLLAGSALSNVARVLAEASIIGIILSIVVALVVWFRSITESTIP